MKHFLWKRPSQRVGWLIQFATVFTWWFIKHRGTINSSSQRMEATVESSLWIASESLHRVSRHICILCQWAQICKSLTSKPCTSPLPPASASPQTSPRPTAREAKVAQIFSHHYTRSRDNWQGQLESESVNRFLFPLLLALHE